MAKFKKIYFETWHIGYTCPTCLKRWSETIKHETDVRKLSGKEAWLRQDKACCNECHIMWVNGETVFFPKGF